MVILRKNRYFFGICYFWRVKKDYCFCSSKVKSVLSLDNETQTCI